jgi:hypothetical protein
MSSKENVMAFKIYSRDKWSIILSEEEYDARDLFLEENNIYDEEIDKIESLDLNTKIFNPYTGKRCRIYEMIQTVNFFPRCILDSNDLEEE